MSSLRPFRWTYPQKTGSGFTIIPRPSASSADLEQYFLQLATRLKTFDVVINHNLPFLLHGYLKEWVHQIQKLQLRVIYRYVNDIERFLKTIDDASADPLTREQTHEVHAELNRMVSDLTQVLEGFQTKARFINDLAAQNFAYYNVGQSTLEQSDDLETVTRVLVKDRGTDRILCSNDTLNSVHQSRVKILVHELVEERKTRPNLRLVYADFSSSPFVLNDILVLPLNTHSRARSPSASVTTNNTTLSSSFSPDDTINILLLGESGVGKSTFVNAFANYQAFETLQRAQLHKPVTIIPASSTERLTTSASTDADSTQHCQSYLLHLTHTNMMPVRFIDTPGFGNARSDERNMQHIVESLHDLSHLSAVCLFMKANESRSNVSFRTWLGRVLTTLSPRARQNIVLCFTNTRPTSYTPGSSTSLLRTLLDSLAINDIPIHRQNTFCFDNESFRHLVASQTGTPFDEEYRQQYATSWFTSANELNRLLTHIDGQLRTCPLSDLWQPAVRARIDISQMVRPMLEAMRNLLRNIILWDDNATNRSIKLCSQALRRPGTFCLSCERDAFRLGNFWILPDDVHELRTRCRTCTCEPEQHVAVEYILSYDLAGFLTADEIQRMKDQLEQLYSAGVEFALHFANAVRASDDDPFLLGYRRMIDEEKRISADHEPHRSNLRLADELTRLLHAHEEQVKATPVNAHSPDSQLIYRRIHAVSKHPTIRAQIDARRQHQRDARKDRYEYDIGENVIRRKVLFSAVC